VFFVVDFVKRSKVFEVTYEQCNKSDNRNESYSISTSKHLLKKYKIIYKNASNPFCAVRVIVKVKKSEIIKK